MISEPKQQAMHQLIVKAVGPLSGFAHITIFNGHRTIVGEGYEEVIKNLPEGIYQIQTELNENSLSEMIVLDEKKEVKVELPRTNSSLPGEDYRSSHEYYTYPMARYSIDPTMEASNQKAGSSSIFIFFRYPNHDLYSRRKGKASLGRNFKLLDSAHQEVFRFTKDFVEEDQQTGWLALHSSLPAGQYYLVYTGTESREIPIRLFNDWQTQIFLTFREKPLFSSMRITIERKGRGINPDPDREKMNYEIDAIAQKLYNGIYHLPNDLIDKIADGKWDNPMLGILGSYVYLKSGRSDKDHLFKTIVTNLEGRILEDSACPDLQALKVLYSLRRGEALPDDTIFSDPCMISLGVKAAIEASYHNENIIVENSAMEEVVDKLDSGLIWTSYRPEERTPEFPWEKVIELGSAVLEGSGVNVSQKLTSTAMQVANSWVIPTVIDKIKDASAEKEYFKENYKKEGKGDLAQVAREIGITPRVLRKTLQEVVDFSKGIKARKGGAKESEVGAVSQHIIDKMTNLIQNKNINF